LNTIILSLLLAFNTSAHIIDGVPFVMQESRYCGPASLASVLAYYGDPVDQKTIGKAVYDPTLQGSLITDLENYARRQGFKTTSDRGNATALKEFVRENRPVIVLVDKGFWVVSNPHYLVIYGFNAHGFIAHDGFEGAQEFPYGKFEDTWEKAGKTYLLIHR
jgi:ABC-type bacteriocin/lantibiotic exporter with double-glycine peptidase domain